MSWEAREGKLEFIGERTVESRVRVSGSGELGRRWWLRGRRWSSDSPPQ